MFADLIKEAIKFKDYMRNFFSKLYQGKNWTYNPDKDDGITPTSWSSGLSALVANEVWYYVDENLRGDWKLFDKVMFSWAETLKEKHRQELDEEMLITEDVSNLNNFDSHFMVWPSGLSYKSAMKHRSERAKATHANEVISDFCFSHVEQLVKYKDILETAKKLGINLKELAKRCTKGTGRWQPKDALSLEQTQLLYVELRKLGYTRQQLVG